MPHDAAGPEGHGANDRGASTDPPPQPVVSAPPPDAQDAVALRFIGHATVLLTVGSVRVLTDPFLRSTLGPLRRHGPAPRRDDVAGVDVVLVSHAHPDHFDEASLRAIPGAPTVIVPRGLGDRARAAVKGEVIEMEASDRLRVGGVELEAVQAQHWMTPGGPRARPLGYVVDAGPRVYFAGDTGPFDGLDALVARADVALLPVWTWGPHRGPGHLGPRSAAEVLAAAGPTVAIPIHWGTLYPVRLHHVWHSPLREPGQRFADHAVRLAPDADVRVLRPGEATAIELPVDGRR